jgi:hypothetical protein
MLTDTMFGGVGLGEEAFRTAYINYAAAGTQSAPHSHSLYMQIAIQLGVIGLILFGVLMFVVCRKCLSSSIYSGSSKEISVASRAALAGAISLLTAGFFDYTWYNFRVFFIFWALLGIACAAVNIHETENSEDIISEGDEYSYSLTVNIPKAKSVNEAEREEEKHDHPAANGLSGTLYGAADLSEPNREASQNRTGPPRRGKRFLRQPLQRSRLPV